MLVFKHVQFFGACVLELEALMDSGLGLGFGIGGRVSLVN